MWRLLRNGLAVGAELHRRRINAGVFCVVCGREETIYHRFWSCPHSAMFWKFLCSELGASVAILPDCFGSQSALSKWLLSWFAEASDDARATMVQGVYALWLARNETREGKRIEEAHVVAKSVSHYMQEWQTVQGSSTRSTKQQQVQKWSAPEHGWLKANVDGATSKSGDDAGGGVVFRDHHGAFRRSACYFFPSISNPETAELLACRRAAHEAVELGVQKVQLELDCKSVVAMLNGSGKNLSAAGPVVEEIKELLRSREASKVTWVSRTANTAAHRLAREGVCNKSCRVWTSSPPDCILRVISEEIPDFAE